MLNVALSFLFFLRRWRAIPKVEGLMMKLMRYLPAFGHHEIITEAFDGVKMKLTLSDLVHQHLFAHGHYEPEATEMWKYCIRNAAVVIDVGANIGYYSLLTAKYGSPGVKIFAFEPIPEIYQRAKENFEMNSFTQATIVNKALSNQAKSEIMVFQQAGNWGGSSINRETPISDSDRVKVETVIFDAFVSELGLTNLDVVKIDVEGFELHVLEGMHSSIQKYRPIIFIEVLDSLLNKFGYSAADVFNWFNSRGYKGYKILQKLQLLPLEQPISLEGLILFAPINDKRILSQIRQHQ